jgi:phosphoglycerol transferase MdoB-like AlkP superfamily enzyme
MLPRTFSSQSLTTEHIPLLLYAPAILKPARYTYPASQLDILPTVAALCSINYVNTTLGKDLLNPSTPRNAFIIDPETRRLGMVQNNLFYSSDIKGNAEQIGSIINNNKVVLTDSLRKSFKWATNAYYETARYLLLNNRKRVQ